MSDKNETTKKIQFSDYLPESVKHLADRSELNPLSGSATTVGQIMAAISAAADGVNDTNEWDECIYGNGMVSTWGLIEREIDRIIGK